LTQSAALDETARRRADGDAEWERVGAGGDGTVDDQRREEVTLVDEDLIAQMASGSSDYGAGERHVAARRRGRLGLRRRQTGEEDCATRGRRNAGVTARHGSQLVAAQPGWSLPSSRRGLLPPISVGWCWFTTES